MVRRLVAVLTLAVLAGSVVGPVRGAQEEPINSEPRPLSVLDTLRINTVSRPHVSPDGRQVLYSQAARDMESEDLASATQVWRVGVDGEGRRKLTQGDKSATSPAWFPAGDKIAFLADRGDKAQVWTMYADGGEAWQVTHHESDVASYRVSPDGERILFVARDAETEEQKRRTKEHDDAVVIDAEFSWSHLWVHELASGESRRLTEGDMTVSDPQWAPGSDRILYVTRPTTNLDDGWNSDIWVVGLEADAAPRRLFDNPGPDASPRWSPDGKTIAFAANTHTSTTTWYNALYLIPAEGGEPEILLEDFDLDFGAPIWAPNGADIYWSTGDRTTTNLFSVQVGTGEWLAHDPPPGRNSAFELSPDGGRWVWVHSDPTTPSDVYTAPADDLSQARSLTDANAWLIDERVQLAEVRAVSWKNSEGQDIEGVVHLPIGYREGVRYPLVVNPHGGPSSARLAAFAAAHQNAAGNGFLVFEPNFRGSSNYGQEFLNANVGYWGVRDYDDIMTGVDALIEWGWVDADRMVAHGWSYGGYMTYWMATQTDRFKVISPGAGLSNLYSMYSTTDISNYLGWFFGTPWENEDIYRRLSPIRHVKNVTAKMLLMHGANDARVPPEQAVEFYRALKDLGKDVTYVSYPRQGHGIREPRLQIDRLRRYVCTFTETLGMEPVTETCGEHPAESEEVATAQR